jgi:predicted nucleotide-binding protein
LTPDDAATPLEDLPLKTFKYRARQNVIYELGFFNGKLGRKHVCALYKNGSRSDIEFELPSDFLGVAYVPMDVNGAWKMELAKEMKAAGLNVNLESLF